VPWRLLRVDGELKRIGRNRTILRAILVSLLSY
jgi:hypothetical protein